MAPGKWLIVAGLALALTGALWTWGGRLGLGRLPGDLVFTGKHWRVFLPLASSILLSLLLTLILNLVARCSR